MAWKLPTHEVRTYKRNTLAAVIVQLRFEPILKVADKVPDFQERVRARFPGFSQSEDQVVAWELSAPGRNPGIPGVRVTKERTARFMARGEPSLAALMKDAVTLEYQQHRERSVLAADMALLVDAMRAVYSPIAPVRLGVRYVNVIDREAIAAELKRPVEWSDLLAAAFLAVPAGLATLEGSAFMAETTSSLPKGSMTLRYGLRRDPAKKGRPTFRLDTDRYLDATFTLEEVAGLLEQFSSDIFQVFTTAAGPALLEWMDQ